MQPRGEPSTSCCFPSCSSHVRHTRGEHKSPVLCLDEHDQTSINDNGNPGRPWDHVEEGGPPDENPNRRDGTWSPRQLEKWGQILKQMQAVQNRIHLMAPLRDLPLGDKVDAMEWRSKHPTHACDSFTTIRADNQDPFQILLLPFVFFSSCTRKAQVATTRYQSPSGTQSNDSCAAYPWTNPQTPPNHPPIIKDNCGTGIIFLRFSPFHGLCSAVAPKQHKLLLRPKQHKHTNFHPTPAAYAPPGSRRTRCRRRPRPTFVARRSPVARRRPAKVAPQGAREDVVARPFFGHFFGQASRCTWTARTDSSRPTSRYPCSGGRGTSQLLVREDSSTRCATKDHLHLEWDPRRRIQFIMSKKIVFTMLICYCSSQYSRVRNELHM